MPIDPTASPDDPAVAGSTNQPATSSRHEAFVRNVAPDAAVPAGRNAQEPLGPAPSYDDALDVAVEYTFPASDPVSVQSICKDAAAKERGEEPERDG
jgi:hypothetical protein